MKITIYTDSSFINRKGAWAAHLECDNQRIEIEGSMDFVVPSSNYAELYAAYKAIEYAINKWKGIKVINIFTDSMAVCNWLYPLTSDPKAKKTREVYDLIIGLMIDYEFELNVQHVKAHSENKINDRVDKRARTLNGLE